MTGKRWNVIFKIKIDKDQIANPYGDKVGEPAITTDPSGKYVFSVLEMTGTIEMIKVDEIRNNELKGVLVKDKEGNYRLLSD